MTNHCRKCGKPIPDGCVLCDTCPSGFQIVWTLGTHKGYSPYVLPRDEAAADIERRQKADREQGVTREYELVEVSE